MNCSKIITNEFAKIAISFWDSLSHEQQQQYLKEHPKSQKHITSTVEDFTHKFQQLDDINLEARRRSLFKESLKLSLSSYRRRQPPYKPEWIEKQLKAVNSIIADRNNQKTQRLKDQNLLATIPTNTLTSILKELGIQRMTESPVTHGTERGHSLQYTPGYMMSNITSHPDSKQAITILPKELQKMFIEEIEAKSIPYKLEKGPWAEQLVIG
ncbi:MAG: hypothetical protein Q7R33_01675 [Nitrosarchaeum sp.]|nr:hypothetical protein [Nitrosarchaeum sp.]